VAAGACAGPGNQVAALAEDSEQATRATEAPRCWVPGALDSASNWCYARRNAVLLPALRRPCAARLSPPDTPQRPNRATPPAPCPAASTAQQPWRPRDDSVPRPVLAERPAPARLPPRPAAGIRGRLADRVARLPARRRWPPMHVAGSQRQQMQT